MFATPMPRWARFFIWNFYGLTIHSQDTLIIFIFNMSSHFYWPIVLFSIGKQITTWPLRGFISRYQNGSLRERSLFHGPGSPYIPTCWILYLKAPVAHFYCHGQNCWYLWNLGQTFLCILGKVPSFLSSLWQKNYLSKT